VNASAVTSGAEKKREKEFWREEKIPIEMWQYDCCSWN
jgi:hypothetical protein